MVGTYTCNRRRKDGVALSDEPGADHFTSALCACRDQKGASDPLELQVVVSPHVGGWEPNPGHHRTTSPTPISDFIKISFVFLFKSGVTWQSCHTFGLPTSGDFRFLLLVEQLPPSGFPSPTCLPGGPYLPSRSRPSFLAGLQVNVFISLSPEPPLNHSFRSSMEAVTTGGRTSRLRPTKASSLPGAAVGGH